jgi:hypothetical protein
MIYHFLARRAKQRANALWIMLVWMEPFGQETWCVWTNDNRELARSKSRLVALWKAGAA